MRLDKVYLHVKDNNTGMFGVFADLCIVPDGKELDPIDGYKHSGGDAVIVNIYDENGRVLHDEGLYKRISKRRIIELNKTAVDCFEVRDE